MSEASNVIQSESSPYKTDNKHISLPLKEGGELVHCTIKDPTAITGRKILKQVKDATLLTIENQQRLNKIGALMAKQTDADAKEQKILLAERNKLSDAYDKVQDEFFTVVIEQVQGIVNIPNDKDGNRRTADDLDWENARVEDLTRVRDFFVQRTLGSANG